MEVFHGSEPLTDAELDRLDRFLENCEGGNAMNLEEMDGFFAALIAGPRVVMPSEYLPALFGTETEEAHIFESLEEASAILALIMRHWNHIAGTLAAGDIYGPLLLAEEDGLEHGNDWARGFIEGTYFCRDEWIELLNDEQHGGCMFAMLMLYHEHDEDPEMRPGPISPERRESVFQLMAAGLVMAYRYFREQPAITGRRPACAARKVGRNEPCPCGSGKKYKRCCGSTSNQ